MTEQWQELKETITELRDNDGTGTQQEVCKFLTNYMEILEKQMQEPCEDAMQKSESVTEFADRCRECGAKYGKYRKKAKRWKNKWLKSQKSGKWMEHGFLGDIWFECNRCGCDSDSSYNYCPNCGARMIEREEV